MSVVALPVVCVSSDPLSSLLLHRCRSCLPNGYYTLELEDTELWETRRKHAKVIFSSGSANATLDGTVKFENFPVGVPWKTNKHNNDDDTPLTESVGFIVGITIACVVVAVLIGFAW